MTRDEASPGMRVIWHRKRIRTFEAFTERAVIEKCDGSMARVNVGGLIRRANFEDLEPDTRYAECVNCSVRMLANHLKGGRCQLCARNPEPIEREGCSECRHPTAHYFDCILVNP